MPVMSRKSIKGIDLFCASPASTAVFSPTTTAPATPLRRLNSYLSDQRRHLSAAPCISELPFTPRPRKSSSFMPPRKSSADVYSSSRYLLGDSDLLFDSVLDSGDSLALVPSEPLFRSSSNKEFRRDDSLRLGSFLNYEKPKSVKSPRNIVRTSSYRPVQQLQQRQQESDCPVLKSSSDKSPKDTIKTSNYGPKQQLQQRQENDCPVLKSTSVISPKNTMKTSNYQPQQQLQQRQQENDYPVLRSTCSTRSRDQVVVLRVSLHCKGCEGKLRKHLSKMQGVKSFSIEMATKKVTVIGDVTPFGVLASISKIKKNAELWPSPSPSSSSSSVSSTVDFSY